MGAAKDMMAGRLLGYGVIYVYLRDVSHEIDLNTLFSEGAIPVEFGALESLQECNLAWNQLSGGIPRELGFLHNLQKLHLGHNKLTGAIPVEIGELGSLQDCDLASNHLSGGIPRELGSLRKLWRLHLWDNKLTGAVPAQLVKLHNLSELTLAGNNFSDPLPSLKQLRDLFDALAGVVSSEEEPLVYNDATGRWEPRLFGQGARAGDDVELVGKATASSAESLVYPGTTNRWEPRLFGQGARAGDDVGLVSEVTASSAETLVYPGTTNRWEPRLFGQGARAGDDVELVSKVTASSAETLVYPGTTNRWEPRLFGQGARAGDDVELVSKVTARTAGFEGDVMAWSFGATSGVIGCPDFELEVPDLGRDVPALIGQSPSATEMIDHEFCLLHPVITCLAGSGEIFNPPLLLRFPVGDIESMESGSDAGSSDGAEESYYTYIKSRYSVVKREENSATWVPISVEILKMDNGVFVLEAQISHFTDYALNQPVEVDQGRVKIVEIKKLPHESRRNVFLFVNQGDEPIVVYYWPRHTRQFWISRVKASLGFASFGIRGAVDRKILNTLNNGVESEVVYSLGRPVVLETSDITSLEVAWATLEEHDGHRLVNVWGKKTMDHKKAMVIGRLQDKVHAEVRNLRIANGEHVGNNVRARLEN